MPWESRSLTGTHTFCSHQLPELSTCQTLFGFVFKPVYAHLLFMVTELLWLLCQSGASLPSEPFYRSPLWALSFRDLIPPSQLVPAPFDQWEALEGD